MRPDAIAESTVEHSASRLDYAELVVRVRELVESVVPPGATVAIVSKGDSELLRLGTCVGWHFPRTALGAYAGHHPAGDDDAIARLETTREEGADFLVLPATAYWWLDHYGGFKAHLESRYRQVAARTDTATIFALEAGSDRPSLNADLGFDAVVRNVRAVATALLPVGSQVIVATRGDERLLNLGGATGWHFPRREGSHPADDPDDSGSAIEHLEVLRSAGAQYLLIPQPAYWWLERYAAFREYLTQTYSLVTR